MTRAQLGRDTWTHLKVSSSTEAPAQQTPAINQASRASQPFDEKRKGDHRRIALGVAVRTHLLP